jgi:hypothetical protein
MKTIIWILSIALFIMTIVLLTECSREPEIMEVAKLRIDTVVVEKIKIVTVKTPAPPAKVIIQKEADTTLRKEAEKKDIIIGVLTEKNKIHVQTIDSLGKVKEKITDIPKGTTETMVDEDGNVGFKKRKKFRAWCDRAAPKIRNGLAYIGAGALIVAGILIGGGG